MLKIFKTIVQENLITASYVLTKSNQQKRAISQSRSCLKKYKYALDQKKQRNSSATQGGIKFGYRKNISEGRALTYFSLDDRNNSSSPDSFTRKQIAYAEIVHGSVEDLLTSKDVDVELQACPIEIVKVEVSPTLSSANVHWSLPVDELNNPQHTKEEAQRILDRNLAQLRLLLPAYTTITRTPCIHFTFDQSEEKRNEIDALFEQIRIEQEVID